MSQQQWRQQNPNPLPDRAPPKAPEVIEYICGGESKGQVFSHLSPRASSLQQSFCVISLIQPDFGPFQQDVSVLILHSNLFYSAEM